MLGDPTCTAPMTDLRLSLAQFLVAYLAVLVVMGVCDGLWLGWLAKGLYQREMGDLMASPIRIPPAAIFYLAYPLGVVFLALGGAPATLADALLRSAVVGLLAYGTYDLTNLAVVRNFSASLAVIDLVYGTVATALAGGTGWWFALRR